MILNLLGGSDDFRKPVWLSLVNRAGATGGDLEEGPAFSAPESVEMWRSAVAGIRRRMDAMGWAETRLLLGTIHDDRNWGPDFKTFFETVAPGTAWEVFTHGRGESVPDRTGPHILSGLRFQHAIYKFIPRKCRNQGNSIRNRMLTGKQARTGTHLRGIRGIKGEAASKDRKRTGWVIMVEPSLPSGRIRDPPPGM